MSTQITQLPTHLPPLNGTLTFAGDLNVNDEEISGVMIDIDRANLIAAKSLPMYQRCVVIPEAEYLALTVIKSIPEHQKCVVLTEDKLQKMKAVIEAAKRIQHWHDREPDGMIVSAEHVRKLWAALHDLEGNATADQPAPEPTCPMEVEVTESRRRFLTIEVAQSLADRICEWTLKYNPSAAEEKAAFDAVKSAKIIKEEIIHDTYEIDSVDFPNAKGDSSAVAD